MSAPRAAAARADEFRLDVGQPDFVAPTIDVGLDMVRAAMVATADHTSRTPESHNSPKVIFCWWQPLPR